MYKCPLCNKQLKNNNTAIIISHMRSHVRKNQLTEENGKFTTTTQPQTIIFDKNKNKKPEAKDPLRKIIYNSNVPPREPTTAKLDNKNQIRIQCNKCKKWGQANESLADERFISYYCCDTLRLFPKRDQSKITKQGYQS